MLNPTFGLKGVVVAQVINCGVPQGKPVVTKNLWLDQGLDNLASMPLCRLFEVAVKGTGTSITTEDQTGSANTYSIPNNSSTMTRTAGTRNFTSGDVGKLIRFTTGEEFRINNFTSATVVSVVPPASPAISNKKGTFYSVSVTALDAEIGRTSDYSGVAGENSTQTAAAVRTFKRTFIFPAEDLLTENIPVANVYSQTGTTVTRTAGTRNFTGGDVGKKLIFRDTQNSGVIVSVGAVDTVTLDTAHENPEGSITLTKATNLKETVTGTYGHSGSTVTRSSGSRDFTAADVGKYIYFVGDNSQAIITAYTSATVVTVDTSGTLTGQSIALYGFTDYQEIGLSHSSDSGGNLNIRVLLSAPVRAYISTPLRASDQLKLTYSCTLTVSPATVTSGNLTSVISDPGSGMSGNKSGASVIETYATSTVTSSGQTDLALTDLEPYYDGTVGLSLNTDALAPLSGMVRSTGLATVPLTGSIYASGTFTRVYSGQFGLNDAINNNWRSLMLVDPDSALAAFTFLYSAVQKKDGEHTFAISFRKTWNRDLS